MIRAARAGQAAAQLALGRRYLFGGAGLPKNSSSALYWLDRAAQQHERDAWMLIGSYIPFETALHADNIQKLCFWYERAAEAGVPQAGLVLAKLILSHPSLLSEEGKCLSALRALHASAEAGVGEAQWLLAQHYRDSLFAAGTTVLSGKERELSEAHVKQWVYWADRAANNGIEAARQALMDDAWNKQDYTLFLKWACPPVECILQAALHSEKVANLLPPHDIVLLKRYAQALGWIGNQATDKRKACLQMAAEAGDAQAQLGLGLLLAGMDAQGRRVRLRADRASYKPALRWLKAASDKGLAEAAYVAAKIYSKPEFSQRNAELAHHFLERAAEAGHILAQLEWGMTLWRKCSGDSDEDVQALYWLCRAAAQGSQEAKRWVKRVAPKHETPSWANAIQLDREQARSYPYLAARIELARRFGLGRAEALLLDVTRADRGHCLVVDIRSQHPRSKRRLITIPDGETRQAMDRIRRLFHDVDCSEHGPEGNYRCRLYRLKRLTMDSKAPVKAVPGVIFRSRPQTPLRPGQSS